MARFEIKQDPWPLTDWQWAGLILSRIFFPPLLILDLFRFLLGPAVGFGILPAQLMLTFDNIEKVDDHKADDLSDQDVLFTKHTVVTYDGIELDTLEASPRLGTEEIAAKPEHQKYVILFNGNAECYEDATEDMKEIATELNCHVIGFNPRGVLGSTNRAPRSERDLITDGITQVQRLLDLGVSPENITLKGHSLGAAIACKVTAYFHERDIRINFMDGRSFSSLTNVIVGQVRGIGYSDGRSESIFGQILGWIVKPIVFVLLALLEWRMDVEDDFKKIPEAYRDYYAVRTLKDNWTDEIKDDAVITHYGSLYATMKDERRQKKTEIEQRINSLNTVALEISKESFFCSWKTLPKTIVKPTYADILNALSLDKHNFVINGSELYFADVQSKTLTFIGALNPNESTDQLFITKFNESPIENLNYIQNHIIPKSEKSLKNEQKARKDRKMYACFNGHCKNDNYIYSEIGNYSGREYFYKFWHRAEADHGVHEPQENQLNHN